LIQQKIAPGDALDKQLFVMDARAIQARTRTDKDGSCERNSTAGNCAGAGNCGSIKGAHKVTSTAGGEQKCVDEDCPDPEE